MDAYEFITVNLGDIAGVKMVTRVSGLTALEGLTDDVGGNAFPCIAVDHGCDGSIDLTTSLTDRRYHTFYVMTSPDAAANVETISAGLQYAKNTGLQVLRLMRKASVNFGEPFFGIELSDITYSRFGPIGLGCYGYAFNYTLVENGC